MLELGLGDVSGDVAAILASYCPRGVTPYTQRALDAGKARMILRPPMAANDDAANDDVAVA